MYNYYVPAVLPSLVTVNLEDTGITDEGVVGFSSTEPVPGKLENLDLSRTKVTHGIIPSLQSKYSTCTFTSPSVKYSYSYCIYLCIR